MPVLPILTGTDNPVLRTKTQKVERVSKELLKFLKDMEETVIAADGLGLAAPQVGSSERVCIVKMHGRLTPLINPEITWKGTEKASAEEGCLSLPGIWLNVERPTEIILKYTDAKGTEQERKLTALSARIVQHEVDHLEGVLIVDYAATDLASSIK